MYIQKAEIKNIRSIVDFEIEFKDPPGWHVLIGDNGAGKSTIVRSMSLGLIGADDAHGLRANWNDWLNKSSQSGEVKLDLFIEKSLDKIAIPDPYLIHDDFFGNFSYEVKVLLSFERKRNGITEKDSFLMKNNEIVNGLLDLDFGSSGFFSVAYGPYRRFDGGNKEWEVLFKNENYADLAGHLSVFGEDVALTEAISWLKDLNYKSLENNQESVHTFRNFKKLINSDDFLPHNAQLESVSSDGVFFKDGNGVIISINQMSDGYRSILSMTFELIRQLVRVYGSELVFKNIENGEIFIDLPGVVLVDEIDAHLHPTWQTRIGQWFLKYFPQLQFIVTTHSPLVCRAAEKGSIWRLAAPGSDEKSGEIMGLDRERLIYGNILDAYGTEVFGENVSISEESNEMLNRLAELNIKSMMGEIDDPEHTEMENLKAVLPTESK